MQTIYTQGAGIQFATINITSSQIKNMGATPIVCIPAPGQNKVIMLQSFVLQTFYGGVAYTVNGGAPKLTYAFSGGLGFTAGLIAAGAWTATDNFILGPATGTNLNTGTAGSFAALVNNSITLSKTGAELTLGNGTARLTLCYYIIDLS